MSYQIKTIAERTGIRRGTLLAWERRYGFPAPDRHANGYRTYTDAELARLLEVKELIDRGHATSEAITLVRRGQSGGVVALEEAPASRTAELSESLLETLIAYDASGAAEIEREVALLAVRQALEEVYLPLLRELGCLWEAGEVTVAQEHFASTFCRERILSMLHSVSYGPQRGTRVVCAGYPGEHHELGLLAVAVKLALSGCRILYLGPDVPVGELPAASQGATLICQSIIRTRPRQEMLDYAQTLRELMTGPPRVVLGGPGVAGLEDHSDDSVAFCPRWVDLEERWEELTSPI